MSTTKTVRGVLQRAMGGAMVGDVFVPDTLIDDVDAYQDKMVEVVGVVDVVQGQPQPNNPSEEGYVQSFEGTRNTMVSLESIRVVEE